MSLHFLQVFRANALIAQFEIDEQTTFSKTLMGDHLIACQVTLPASLPIQLGDYISYKSRVYKINTLPELTKDDVNYTYGINFEPDIYSLYNKLFMHLGDTDFTYFGTLHQFAQLLIDNINSTESGWSLGIIDDLPEKEIIFSADTCRTALTKIAEAFNVEYDVDGKVITIKKTIGRQTDLTFKVGIYQGLYSLKRTVVSDKNVVTVVYGFGSDKNIDLKYRNNTKRLVFESRKLSRNVDLYGYREGIYTNDDIYPHRTGTVSAVSGTLKVIDSSIDFDFNTYLLEGEPAHISFTSGELSGVTFEMESYHTSTKTITFKEFKDTNDYILPSTTRQAKVGDKYVMLDINMPQSYIDKAEAELQDATQTYLNENSVPQVMYDLDLDEKYIRDNNIVLNAGDFIRIVDAQLQIDGYLRISQITYPLVNESAIKATISNFIIDSSQNRLKAAILNNQTEIKQVYTGNILESRRQTANLALLKDTIFDNDGYFDGTHLKPNSIETLYLSTGSKANDFNLSEVVIKANLLGNQNDIQITDGRLLHNSIEIAGLGFIWVMNGITQSGLTANTQYWLYAKCSKNTLTGTFVVSSAKIGVNDLAGYFHFTIGTLYPAKDGWRDFDFTKGMAYLVGDTLKAGRIQSIDAQTYWDLTQGKFKIGSADYGLDWNVTTPNQLTIRGAVVQSPGGATSPINVFRGSYVAGQTYFKGDSVQFNGSTWNYINSTPTNNQPPAENTYWTASAKKGNDGTSVNIKGTVAAQANLPTSGNTVGDGYITNDTKHLWMWTGTAWTDLGSLQGPAGATGLAGKAIRMRFAKNNSLDSAPALSQVYDPAGWTADAPTTDDNIYLGDNTGNLITDNAGNYIGVGIYPEYLWQIIENVDANGNWLSWSPPNRLTGRPAPAADYTEVRFAVSGSPTVPPTLNVNSSDPSGWTVKAPSFTTLQYLWKTYGVKDGETKLLKGSWNTPIRETAIDGQNGANGLNSYFHIAYASNASGTVGFNFTSGDYIGLYSDYTPANSTNPALYKWSLFKGQQGGQGMPGQQGSDGRTSYLHIKYSNNGGSSFTGNNGEDPGDFIGTYVDFTEADSNSPSVYSWSKTRGDQGIQGPVGPKGDQGAQGPVGPLPQGGGIYDPTKTYTGSLIKVDIVRYNDGTGEKAFVARTDAGAFSGVLPTNTSKWNAFGAQFSSVATDLFFSQLAFIENLGVRYLRTAETGRRMEIIGDTNSQTFYDANDNALTAFKDDVDEYVDDDDNHTYRKLSGMNFNKYYSSNPSNPDIVKITGNGVYSNTGYSQIALNSVGWYGFGSIVGYIRRAIANLATGDIHAAVIGVSAVANGFGGYFRHTFGGTSLYVDGIIKVKKGTDEFQAKSGYVQCSAFSPTGRYFGFKVVNGIVVEDGGPGGYSSTEHPPGLS